MQQSLQAHGQAGSGTPKAADMSELKTCGKEGCRPVMQVRGEMGHGDYVDVIKAHEHVMPNPALSRVDMHSSYDLHEIIEMEEDSKSDIRICCYKCGKVTGWQRRDAPGMPEVGIFFTQKTWNGLIDGGHS
jgi:hypothetical protein